MLVEYLLNVALIVTVVSLITMLIIILLELTIPEVLLWISGASLVLAVGSWVYMQKTKDKYLY